MKTENTLPSLQDITTDIGVYQEHDKLNHLLCQQPPESWVSDHPFIKKEVTNEQGQKIRVPYRYLPIDKVEHLLRKIFKKYRIEVMQVQPLFNAVQVSVRVHYKDLVTSNWDFHDGVGAVQLQTAKGKSPSDYANINNGAVMMATPHAKTLAIKDACDMFGDLFGANLNRDSLIPHTMDAKDPKKEVEELFENKKASLSGEEISQIERVINNDEEESYSKVIEILKSK